VIIKFVCLEYGNIKLIFFTEEYSEFAPKLRRENVIPSKSEFAQNLTIAVHRISLRESNKPIRVVQDELGYALGKQGGSAIEYWRKGHIPSHLTVIENLAKEIIHRSDLDRDWLLKYLISAGYPAAEDFCNRLFPTSSPVKFNFVDIPLPRKSFRKLVGRDDLIDTAIQSYRETTGCWGISIDGMGGIGKTALAREIIDRCLNAKIFDASLWINASRIEMKTKAFEDVSFTFEHILNILGNRLGLANLETQPLSEKEERIRIPLQRYRLLLVLDNLETAAEPQEQLLQRLRPLMGVSKALLTSRKRFSGPSSIDLLTIHLTGLGEDKSLEFIRQETDLRGISRVASAFPDDLDIIVEVTGGSPLAMKLVIGQLTHLPLNIILEHIKKGHPLQSNKAEDDYYLFYKFIYYQSWKILSLSGKKLLVAASTLVPGLGVDVEALRAISGLLDGDLFPAIDELWKLSLLDVGESSLPGLANVSYVIHPLTSYFVHSDVLHLLESSQAGE
jgi:hypothetical protein